MSAGRVTLSTKACAMAARSQPDIASATLNDTPIIGKTGVATGTYPLLGCRSNKIHNKDNSNNNNNTNINNVNIKRKNRKRPAQPETKQLLRVEIKPTMDLCNLYIKGLPSTMTSSQLFNTFKAYGRIISARVMASERGISKGFGFVSYSQPVEAASALVHLRRYYTIQFHEPKVPHPDHDIQQQYWSLVHSSLHCHFYASFLSVSRLRSFSAMTPTTVAEANSQLSPQSAQPMTDTLPFYTYHAAPTYYYYYQPNTTYYSPYLYSSANDAMYYLYYSQQHAGFRQGPIIGPITSSTSSELSESPSITNTLRSQMVQAVKQVLISDDEQQQIVDMLMKFDESEKEKCISDPTYLKNRLDQVRKLQFQRDRISDRK